MKMGTNYRASLSEYPTLKDFGSQTTPWWGSDVPSVCFKLFLAVLFVRFPITFCSAQEAPEPVMTGDSLNLDMYSRIRSEGFEHSHVMEYAAALSDDIGSRLTGSPNLSKAYRWTSRQFVTMGCSNVHAESWGDFGMGWRQIATSVNMASPDTAVFIAQATPWSPATNGSVNAGVIAVPDLKEERDFVAWKGKLAGKIILYGNAPASELDPQPLMERYDVAKLSEIVAYPLNQDFSEQNVFSYSPPEWADIFKKKVFRARVLRFFEAEHAAAVLVYGWAGDGGVMKDDNGEMLDQLAYMPDHKQTIPSAVIANEGFGRISRLLAHNVPVNLNLEIRSEFTGDHEQGYNIVAEISGTDPRLKDQVVMLGGHLDSWIAGTGATDDGAGVIITMEAMRILTALGVHPRRTIRAALWSGEEQGELGSLGYVHRHFATMGYASTPEQRAVPEFLRERVGPITPQPAYDKLSVYFNIDNGGGKLLGIYADGNEAAAEVFGQWIKPLNDIGVSAVALRPSRSSDQDSFSDVGLPAFQFIQDPRDYKTRSVHTNQDTYERLSPDDLKQAAIVEAIFVYNAAMREQSIPRKPMRVSSRKSKTIPNLMPDAVLVK